MDPCDYCPNEIYSIYCRTCTYGNPCLGCEDYDFENDTCKSYGGCGNSPSGL